MCYLGSSVKSQTFHRFLVRVTDIDALVSKPENLSLSQNWAVDIKSNLYIMTLVLTLVFVCSTNTSLTDYTFNKY